MPGSGQRAEVHRRARAMMPDGLTRLAAPKLAGVTV
jgi:hypothetical protein